MALNFATSDTYNRAANMCSSYELDPAKHATGTRRSNTNLADAHKLGSKWTQNCTTVRVYTYAVRMQIQNYRVLPLPSMSGWHVKKTSTKSATPKHDGDAIPRKSQHCILTQKPCVFE
jgi:hypothetical protein